MYYTLDHNGEFIVQGATMLLPSDVKQLESKLHIVAWEEGAWGDCWMKLYKEPDSKRLEILAQSCNVEAEDIRVPPPGTHPGGACGGCISQRRFLFQFTEADHAH